MARLRGMTWRHARGTAPLQAATETFCRDHPDVAISWDARSLREFEETSVPDLAERYDLLMIDHPFVGLAARSRALVALDQVLPAEFLADQAANSVGPSHASYLWGGHQWAVATDAAAQVSAYREDLLAVRGVTVPTSWQGVWDLAGDGSVAMPLHPTHLFCSLMTVYANLCDKDAPGTPERPLTAERGLDVDVATEALEHVYRLAGIVHPISWDSDPIALLGAMAEGDEVSYAPLCFGYSNYARAGYAANVVRFADIPSFGTRPSGALLGGVGMAVSRRCADLDVAVAFLTYVNGPECQRDLYTGSGGQPGHGAAWHDPEANRQTNGFFADTLQSLELASVRPRLDTYPRFQRKAGELLAVGLRDGQAPARLVTTLNRQWESAVAAARRGGDVPPA